MSNFRLSPILLAAPVLLMHAGLAQAQTTPATPLTPTPASVALSYQKPSTPGSAATVRIAATASTFFTVDAASIPVWLTVSPMNGTAVSAGVNLTFTPNSVGASLGAGSFSGIVKLKVSGTADLSVPVSLLVKNVASTLSVRENTTQTLTWAQGAAFPSNVTLTAVSSNEQIAFTAVASVTAPTTPAAWLKINRTSGVAFNTGTPIVVSFNSQVFQQASVGDALTGSVVITPSSGSAVTVNFTITVTPPVAAISSLLPAEIASNAAAVSGDIFPLVITGTGFVGAPAGQKTVITVGADTIATANVNVLSSTQMIVTLPSDTYLAAAADLTIGASNPDGSGSPAVSNATLKVVDTPIIYAVTSSASYIQAAPGSMPTVAPFELISIFGNNFIMGADTALTLSGTLDSFGRYPNKLTTSDTKDIVVSFYKPDNTLIGNAYLLFATKTQINALVPSGVAGNATVKIKVTYDAAVSSVYIATVATAVPGVFTLDASGQGQAAVLHTDYSVNGTTNKVAKGATVSIYVAGLGTPNSTATNVAATTAATFPASCISPTAYMGTINAGSPAPSTAWTTIDGAVILGSKITAGHFAPCFGAPSGVTVTIDGKVAAVSYAGFVADSLAGLYQVNAVVPTTATSGNSIPLVVSVGTLKSQPGVTMAIQ